MAGNVDSSWSLEREIVLCRVFDAPRALVFAAWTQPEHLTAWFCPKRFTTKTHEVDIRVGGRWRFDMIAPDGTLYPNLVVFREIRSPDRLVFEHGRDAENSDGIAFHVTITFDEQSDGKTVVTLRQLHPSKERRDAVVGFGAVEIGYGTLDNLAIHLARAK